MELLLLLLSDGYSSQWKEVGIKALKSYLTSGAKDLARWSLCEDLEGQGSIPSPKNN
jgi:hypothetical protein